MSRELAIVEATAVTDYVPAVSVTLEQAEDNFRRLQDVTRKLMEPNVDFGQIPGTPKPTLLKPGAERLLQFFGLGHRVERVAATEDWEQGFFYYCYKVQVVKARPLPDGSVYEQIIAECEGSANSKEPSRRNQDPFGIVNTIQKMAIKRALVGATLQATGTSGMFTQDLEDMPQSPTPRDRQPRQNTLDFGKHKHKTIEEVWASDPGYVKWLATTPNLPPKHQWAKDAAKRLVEASSDYEPPAEVQMDVADLYDSEPPWPEEPM